MAVREKTTAGVAVITHKARALLPACLSPILASPLRPKVLVVNSSSNDGTVELAKEMGAETLVVPRHQFNHGATRELARRALATDIVVMITPDARPSGAEMVGNLVRPIADGAASVTYARQLPHDGADFFESFPRYFNYPAESELRSIDDVKSLGAYTFFCSDSCAAWSNIALDSIGGFQATLSLEDTIAAAKLLRAGHKIAYCADAIVQHSHRYSLVQEFKRHFDAGYVRSLNRELLFIGGGDERRGAKFSTAMLWQLTRRRPLLIPYGVATLGFKYFGYLAGSHGHSLPVWIKRRFSGQDYFWMTGAVESAE